MKTTTIGIAGGTASGKTTLSLKIVKISEKFGSVKLIRMDDYYRDFSHLSFPERTKINYDHPSSYNIDLLINHLNHLKKGLCIQKPIYDFVNHLPKPEKETVEPANVIILEGILLFVIPELRNLFDIKLYVHTPDDVRFIRRLRRDINERGRTIDTVINQYYNTVRPMHIRFVEPSMQFADLIIPEGGENKVAIDIIAGKIVNLLNRD